MQVGRAQVEIAVVAMVAVMAVARVAAVRMPAVPVVMSVPNVLNRTNGTFPENAFAPKPEVKRTSTATLVAAVLVCTNTT